MKILLLASGLNGLCQRVYRELNLMGHIVTVEFSISEDTMTSAVDQFNPDIIICPFLKERIPQSIWEKNICLVVHPGIVGDRGPSSLDWAISSNNTNWGVTLLQAAEEMDAGGIWATKNFHLRKTAKGSIYRREVTQQAVYLIKHVVNNINNNNCKPLPLNYNNKAVKGRLKPSMKQEHRKINWQVDNTESVIQKINAADSFPGVLDDILGEPCYLYGAKKERDLRGKAGVIIARCDDAICKATIDGAVWIRMARRKHNAQLNNSKTSAAKLCGIKLPATQILDSINLRLTRKVFIPRVSNDYCDDISWRIENNVAYLYFDFYNGAMNTQQCQRLKKAYLKLKEKPVKVIVLMGGEDFWSNGIHLNCIEAAKDPADESWKNIQAIDDLVEEIIQSPKHITLAALRNNAGAGGAIMPLACDKVILRGGVVLTPYYATMGLYGSEYWTYLLPRRVGHSQAHKIIQSCIPLLAAEALFIGLGDELLCEDWGGYHRALKVYAERFTKPDVHRKLLSEKRKQREADEKDKRLTLYRKEELSHMWKSFSNQNSDYHSSRYNFVHKIPPTKTPNRFAQHRGEPLICSD